MGAKPCPCLTIPYYNIPYDTMLCLTIRYHILPYHTIPYFALPYHTIICLTIPYNITPRHTIQCCVVPQHAKPFQDHTKPHLNILFILNLWMHGFKVLIHNTTSCTIPQHIHFESGHLRLQIYGITISPLKWVQQ